MQLSLSSKYFNKPPSTEFVTNQDQVGNLILKFELLNCNEKNSSNSNRSDKSTSTSNELTSNTLEKLSPLALTSSQEQSQTSYCTLNKSKTEFIINEKYVAILERKIANQKKTIDDLHHKFEKQDKTINAYKKELEDCEAKVRSLVIDSLSIGVLFFKPTTKICVRGDKCKNKKCFFAHNQQESKFLEIKNIILGAKESLHVCAYTFTYHLMKDWIVDLRNKNPRIDIKIIVSKPSNLNDESDKTWSMFEQNKIKVRWYDGENWVHSNNNRSIMHMKYIVRDKERVLFGSFNFSYNASHRNREAAIILPIKKVAKQFDDNFQELWDLCKSPAAFFKK